MSAAMFRYLATRQISWKILLSIEAKNALAAIISARSPRTSSVRCSGRSVSSRRRLSTCAMACERTPRWAWNTSLFSTMMSVFSRATAVTCSGSLVIRAFSPNESPTPRKLAHFPYRTLSSSRVLSTMLLLLTTAERNSSSSPANVCSETCPERMM